MSFLSLAAVFFAYLVLLAVYRLHFSPIGKFPGPKLAALSRWYEFYYEVILRGQFTFHIAELHKKYGKIHRSRYFDGCLTMRRAYCENQPVRAPCLGFRILGYPLRAWQSRQIRLLHQSTEHSSLHLFDSGLQSSQTSQGAAASALLQEANLRFPASHPGKARHPMQQDRQVCRQWPSVRHQSSSYRFLWRRHHHLCLWSILPTSGIPRF